MNLGITSFPPELVIFQDNRGERKVREDVAEKVVYFCCPSRALLAVFVSKH